MSVIKKIEKLTPQQMARLAEFRDAWTAIGLSTDKADRVEAERGIRLAYMHAGKQPPKKIVWCESPLSQGLTRAIVRSIADGRTKIGKCVWASVRDSVWDSVWASVRDSVGDSVRDSVWASVGASVGASVRDSVRDSVWASVWASVRDSVRDSVWASVRDSVWASVRDSVGASVRDSVWDSVWDSVRDSVRASVRASVGASVRDSVRDSVWASVWASVRASVGDNCYGQHDAPWLSFYAFFRETCDLKPETEKLEGLILQAKSAGWFLPHEHICWVSERPTQLHRDERGRLHNPEGMAIRYPDGWGIYAWHGTRLPAWPFEPGQFTAQKILQEENAEVRRALIEKYGQSRFILDCGAKELDSYREYRLLSIDLPGDPDGSMVAIDAVCPSTGAHYILRVPPTMKTVKAAVPWIADIKPKEYWAGMVAES